MVSVDPAPVVPTDRHRMDGKGGQGGQGRLFNAYSANSIKSTLPPVAFFFLFFSGQSASPAYADEYDVVALLPASGVHLDRT